MKDCESLESLFVLLYKNCKSKILNSYQIHSKSQLCLPCQNLKVNLIYLSMSCFCIQSHLHTLLTRNATTFYECMIELDAMLQMSNEVRCLVLQTTL